MRSELIPRLDARRSDRYTPEERLVLDAVLRREVQKRCWYHQMNLGSDIETPGFAFHDLWNNIRLVRDSVSFVGKSVLDLACYDGMWAFEAEALNASLVVAVDCCESWRTPDYERCEVPTSDARRLKLRYQGHENFHLVREALGSDVVGYFNVPLNHLVERLDSVLVSHPAVRDGFEIVQHFGALYHVRDPMLSLAQARSVLRDGGTLLLETGIYNASTECALFFNRDFHDLFDDVATWWLPTLEGLKQMLTHSLFDVDESSIIRLTRCGAETHDRVALKAIARPPSDSVNERYYLDPGFGHGFSSSLFRRSFG